MHPQDGRVISNFIMQALRNEDITIFGDGSQTRSFQYCDDLIEAFRRYMEFPKSTIRSFLGSKSLTTSCQTLTTPAVPVINTGNPGEYTIKQLAEEALCQMPESKSKLIYKPLSSDDPKKRKPDITLAHALLNSWEPKVSLQDGLAKTIAYFKGRFA